MNDDTLALDLIKEVGWKGQYLDKCTLPSTTGGSTAAEVAAPGRSGDLGEQGLEDGSGPGPRAGPRDPGRSTSRASWIRQ